MASFMQAKSFADVLTSDEYSAQLSPRQKRQRDRVVQRMQRRPRLAAVMEQTAMARYEEITGETLPATIDWSAFVDAVVKFFNWLIANADVLLALLLRILSLFGLMAMFGEEDED